MEQLLQIDEAKIRGHLDHVSGSMHGRIAPNNIGKTPRIVEHGVANDMRTLSVTQATQPILSTQTYLERAKHVGCP